MSEEGLAELFAARIRNRLREAFEEGFEQRRREDHTGTGGGAEDGGAADGGAADGGAEDGGAADGGAADGGAAAPAAPAGAPSGSESESDSTFIAQCETSSYLRDAQRVLRGRLPASAAPAEANPFLSLARAMFGGGNIFEAMPAGGQAQAQGQGQGGA